MAGCIAANYRKNIPSQTWKIIPQWDKKKKKSKKTYIFSGRTVNVTHVIDVSQHTIKRQYRRTWLRISLHYCTSSLSQAPMFRKPLTATVQAIHI